MCKTEVIGQLKKTITFISVHEHVGKKTLFFTNGKSQLYSQSIDQLINSLEKAAQEVFFKKSTAIVFVIPQYKNFMQKGDTLLSSEQVNNELFTCLIANKNYSNLLPSIFVAVSEGRKSIEKQIKKYREYSYCIKLHPLADLSSARDVVNSGLFEIAKEYCLPVTIHCSRPGLGCDVNDIMDIIVPAATENECYLNLAHAGFLDERIFEIIGNPYIFCDISPWSILVDQYLGYYDEYQAINLLEKLISKLPKQLLFGFDSPFNVQVWDDNSLHGKDIMTDINIIKQAIGNDKELMQNFFYKNPLSFIYHND